MKKGFTLLELIIVIIIIGVLASLALPKLFSLVEASYGVEAVAAIGTIRAAMERCSLMSNGSLWHNVAAQRCGISMSGVSQLDIPNPADAPGAHFRYYAGPDPDGRSYLIFARRVGGGYDGHRITMGLGYRVRIPPTNRPGLFSYEELRDGRIYWYADPVYRGIIPK